MLRVVGKAKNLLQRISFLQLLSTAPFSIIDGGTFIAAQSPLMVSMTNTFMADARIHSNHYAEYVQKITSHKKQINYAQFNISEVIAYRLAIRVKQYIQTLTNEEHVRQIASKPVQSKYSLGSPNSKKIENYFFNELKSEISLIIREYKVLIKIKKTLSNYEQNILKGQLIINIRRRFIQVMKFYEKQMPLADIILENYEKIAQRLIQLLALETLENNYTPPLEKVLKIINEVSPVEKESSQNSIHHLVGDQFRSLFSTNINEELWSPYIGTQQRFLDSEVNYPHKQNRGSYLSMSFIPTSVTQQMFEKIETNCRQNFISGFKTLGKSLNFMLYITLKNYFCCPNTILWPDFVQNSISMLEQNIFQSYWMRFDLDQMKQWQQLTKSSNREEKSTRFFKIKNFLATVVPNFQNDTKIIIDQFSTYAGKIYDQKKSAIQLSSIISENEKIFKFLMQTSLIKIFGSSVQYKYSIFEQALQGINKQSVSQLHLNSFFKDEQAEYIIKTWLKKINASDNSQSEQKIKKLKLAQNILSFYFSYEKEDIRKRILIGGMSLLKFFSEQFYLNIIDELDENEKKEFEHEKKLIESDYRLAQRIKELIKEYLIKWYMNEIKSWISNETEDEIKNSRRYFITLLTYTTKDKFLLNSVKQKVIFPSYFLTDDNLNIYDHLVPIGCTITQKFRKTLLLMDPDQFNKMEEFLKTK